MEIPHAAAPVRSTSEANAAPWRSVPEALASRLGAIAERFPGVQASIACLRLLDDRTPVGWHVDGHRVVPAASLIKVPIAAALEREAWRGRLTLNDPIRVTTRVTCGEEEFDDLAFAPEGACMTLRKLMDRMITESDNTATNLLIGRLGSATCGQDDGPGGMAVVNDLLAELGLTETRLRRLMIDREAAEAGRENTTTACEMVRMLAELFRRHDAAGDPTEANAWRRWSESWQLLRQQRDRSKIPRRLPREVIVAHKTGELAGARHDAGLLEAMAGGPRFFLSVLTTGPDADRLGNTVIGLVAEAVWAHEGVRQSEERARWADFLPRVQALALDPREAIADVELQAVPEGMAVGGETDRPEVVELARGYGAVLDRLKILPAPGQGEAGWVVAPAVQVRKGPGHGHELVTQAAQGTPVEVLEKTDEWWRLRLPDGYLGWGRSANLSDRDPWEGRHTDRLAMVVLPMAVGRALDGGDDLPLSGGTIVATQAGATQAAEPGATWLVWTTGGRHLALPAHAIAELAPRPDGPRPHPWPLPARKLAADEVANLAHAFAGLPYVWGGATGWGVDCSGFSQLLFRMAGYAIPRDADQQENATRPSNQDPADRTLLRVGDLAFFPGHVAVCVGDRLLLHASSPAGGVVLNSLDPGDPRYSAWLADHFSSWGRVVP